MDAVMRMVMRVGEEFEKWACLHVAFHELDNVWPYFLDERFGAACLDVMDAGSLAGLDAEDCLRMALALRLPIKVDGSLPLPVRVEAANPLACAEFQRLRIQTVRQKLGGDAGMVVFAEDDDPFDKNYGAPVFGIYGIRENGMSEHIADVKSYRAARELLAKLLPGIDVPEEVVAFSPARRLDAIGVAV